MSNTYYYFVSSLPSIFFDSKIPMTVESFLENCDYQLSEGDSALIRSLVEPASVCNFDVEASALWSGFDNNLKNQMVCCRAKKMGKDPQLFMRGEQTEDSILEAFVGEALKENNLLDGENLIDKKRWEYLDELESAYFFDFTNIIVYGLKLKILEKYNKISSDEGNKVLQEYKSIAISD